MFVLKKDVYGVLAQGTEDRKQQMTRRVKVDRRGGEKGFPAQGGRCRTGEEPATGRNGQDGHGFDKTGKRQ